MKNKKIAVVFAGQARTFRAVKDKFQMQPELFSDSSWVINKNEIK